MKYLMGIAVLALALVGARACGLDVADQAAKLVTSLIAAQSEGGAPKPAAVDPPSRPAKPAPMLVEDQIEGLQQKRRLIKRQILVHADSISHLAVEDTTLAQKEADVKQRAAEQARKIATVIAAVCNDDVPARTADAVSAINPTSGISGSGPASTKQAAVPPRVETWVLAGWLRVRGACGTWSSGPAVFMNTHTGDLRANGQPLVNGGAVIWASSGNRQLWQALRGPSE